MALPGSVGGWVSADALEAEPATADSQPAPATGKLRVKYSVPGSPLPKKRFIHSGQTIQEVIDLIAGFNGVEINQLSLDGCVLDADGPFYAYYESDGQLFVFSKAGSAAPASLPTPTSPLPPRAQGLSDYVRDFAALTVVRILGRGATGWSNWLKIR
jgi:hypothetical protein